MQGRIISASTILVILSILPLRAQFNTYSVYTRFGLGDLAKNGIGQNQAMGGTGLALTENNWLNFVNPAGPASMDSMSVFFDFGANAFFNEYRTENFHNYWFNMNLHHVVFASTMGKHFALTTGIVPYSSIGYSIKQEYDNFTTGDAVDYFYSGDGGIMNFFVGTSGKFFNRLSVGITMNYLLGRLTRERLMYFPANALYTSINTIEDFKLRKPVFSLGLQYRENLGERFFFSVGGLYDIETNVGAGIEYAITNNFYNQNGAFLNDSVYIDASVNLGEDTITRKFSIPRRIGMGISLGIPDKLTFTGDYYIQDWNNTLSGENYSLVKSTSMHFGASYTPDIEALRGYHKLITYRIGGYYSNYYLEVNGHQLKDYGITFGVGLPVRSRKTSFNVAFTLGSRGTTEYNLVQENYGIITFNITLHDLWFYKRKFD